MAINWNNIYKKYKGLWIALLEDEKTVVGSGKTAKDALLEAIENGYNSPILTRAPREITTYVG